MVSYSKHQSSLSKKKVNSCVTQQNDWKWLFTNAVQVSKLHNIRWSGCKPLAHARGLCLGVARPARFERATLGLEDRCSIQLSYGRKALCGSAINYARFGAKGNSTKR
jgi:hypothetical protein